MIHESIWCIASHVINSMILGSAIIKVEGTGRNGFGGGFGSNGEIEGTIGQRSCLVKLPPPKKTRLSDD